MQMGYLLISILNYCLFILSIFHITFYVSVAENVCYKDNCDEKSDFRYLFYDVNLQEGFNLRRDVYMRFAVLAHKMQKSKNPYLKFKLVLPPWSYLMHWGYSEKPQHIPWAMYFDIKSMQDFAPVIEMHQFFSEYHNKYSKIVMDEVYTLQHFNDMFDTGNFEDRMKIEDCTKQTTHSFLFYNNITSKTFYCLSYHGPATKLTEVFLNSTARTIFIEHAEVALHDFFGNKLYWEARRSMRFNKELKSLAADFRKIHFNSNDNQDNTLLPVHWKHEKPRRNSTGGSYLAVHLRRRDFVKYRPKDAPPIKIIAEQIKNVLKKLKLTAVFVASDGSPQEFSELKQIMSSYEIIKYTPPDEVINKYGPGGIAILDQIICSHARYFIGTSESTFTFRIQEEREILGFPIDTTFNVFCNNSTNCNKPSIWKIVY